MSIDAELDRRGWRVEAPTFVLTSSVVALLSRTEGAAGWDVQVFDRSGSVWLNAWKDIFEITDAQEQADEILTRIQPSTLYVVVTLEDRPIGTALAVREGEWTGIFGMGTVAGMRRKGVGTAALRAVARWARDNGSTDAYLQVEEDNEHARSFYLRMGFSELYRYHYRTAIAGKATSGAVAT